MKYKAIIFDMDGTIINSENLWEQADKEMLLTKGNVTESECQTILPQIKGLSLHASCTFVAMKYNTKESVQELMKFKEEFAFKNFEKFTTFIDGFEAFHNTITNLGMKTAIATNATIHTLDKTKKYLPLEQYFNKHIYSYEHAHKKPKPEPDVFLYAADQINIDPSLCIVIEDSATGIAAAKVAGMYCIGINTGNDRSQLCQADLVIEQYKDINLDQILA